MKYIENKKGIVRQFSRFIFSSKIGYVIILSVLVMQPFVVFAIPEAPMGLRVSGSNAQPTINWNVVSGEATSGAKWEEASSHVTPLERGYHTSVVFKDKMWILGGVDYSTYPGTAYNDVWSSSDGVTWTEETANAGWSPRAGHTAIVFNDKLWVMGGYGPGSGPDSASFNDVWYSEDGVNWTEATGNAAWGARNNMGTVIFDNKLWVLGGYGTSTGYFNDAWYSIDGVNWTEATNNGGWLGRDQSGGAVVFDNKIWILGGEANTTSGLLSDIWYSADGANWTEVTSEAPWGLRGYHGIATFEGKLWITGGFHGETWDEANDVWYSKDGINWTEATSNAAWGVRDAQTNLIFDNKLWVLGGYRDSDVWHTSAPPTITSYKLCWDHSEGGCGNSSNINVGTTSYTLPSALSSGTWYFSVAAINSSNQESVLSSSTPWVVTSGKEETKTAKQTEAAEVATEAYASTSATTTTAVEEGTGRAGVPVDNTSEKQVTIPATSNHETPKAKDASWIFMVAVGIIIAIAIAVVIIRI